MIIYVIKFNIILLVTVRYGCLKNLEYKFIASTEYNGTLILAVIEPLGSKQNPLNYSPFAHLPLSLCYSIILGKRKLSQMSQHLCEINDYNLLVPGCSSNKLQ